MIKFLEYPPGYDEHTIDNAPFKEQFIVILRKKFKIDSDLFDLMTFNYDEYQLYVGGFKMGFEPYNYIFDLVEWEAKFKDCQMFHHALDSIGLDAISKRETIDLENSYNGFK